MVRIDPGYANEHLTDQLFLTGDDLTTMTKQNADFRALLVDCANLARAHDFAAMLAKQCPCGAPSGEPSAITTRFVTYCATPEHYEGVLAETSPTTLGKARAN